jgi:hypothetical protein
MTEQQDYAETQHELCCTLLGIAPQHDSKGPTLWDAIRDLIKERDTLKTDHTSLAEKTDAALLDAVKQGIAATPDRTLSDDVLAAFRMPMQASMFAKATKGFPKGARCTQRGTWFLILKP